MKNDSRKPTLTYMKWKRGTRVERAAARLTVCNRCTRQIEGFTLQYDNSTVAMGRPPLVSLANELSRTQRFDDR